MRNVLAAFAAAIVVASVLVAGAPAQAATVSVSGTVMFGTPDAAVAPTSSQVLVTAQPVGTISTLVPGTYAYAAAGGAWSLSLPAGAYQIHFWFYPSPGYEDYSPMWYGDSATQSGATVVTVGTTPITSLETYLPVGMLISGHIAPPPGGTSHPMGVTAYILDPVNDVLTSYRYDAADGLGNFELPGLPPGDYLLRFFDPIWTSPAFDEQVWAGAQGLYDATLITVQDGSYLVDLEVQLTADGPLWVDRAAGADRIATSVAISQGAFDDSSGGVTFIANGYNFPDGLSAGPAAAELGGPVLLTAPDQIRSDVIAEIDRLNPSGIVVVGGYNMVSLAAEQQLRARYGTSSVTRLGGANRFETSALIAAYAFPSGTDTAFIASGLKFPDALSAGPAAANRGGPVLLVPPGDTLDSGVSDVLVDLGVQTVFIAGGEPSVSIGVEADLNSVPGVQGVQRFGGSNRYETARLINEAFFQYADTAFLASGLNFPDALAGSAAAGALGAPIYLTSPQCLAAGVYNTWRNAGGTLMVTLGGQPSVSDTAYFLVDC